MNNASPTHNGRQRLAAFSDWVEGLARRLIRDVRRAEDLAQDVWLAAMVQGSKSRGSLSAWMAGATRNLAEGGACFDARRLNRERESASYEALPSGQLSAAKLEQQGLLIRAVLA